MKQFIKEAAIMVVLCAVVGLAVNFPLVKRCLRGEFKEGFIAPAVDSRVVRITFAEAEDLFVERKALFVDARSRQEFVSGHVPGAINLPYDGSTRKKPGGYLPVLPRESTLVVYCSGGDCLSSLAIAGRLVAEGFGDVRVFQGGWTEWKQAGLPSEESRDQE